MGHKFRNMHTQINKTQTIIKKKKKCEIGASEIQRSHLEGKGIYKRHEKIRKDSPGKKRGSGREKANAEVPAFQN